MWGNVVQRGHSDVDLGPDVRALVVPTLFLRIQEKNFQNGCENLANVQLRRRNYFHVIAMDIKLDRVVMSR